MICATAASLSPLLSNEKMVVYSSLRARTSSCSRASAARLYATPNAPAGHAVRQAAAGKATQYYVLATWLVLFRPELFNTGSLPSLGPSLIKLGLPKDCSISEIKAYLNSSK